MRLLLDHCVPKRFGRELGEFDVRTAFQMKWSDLDNGSLLSAAAAGGFDIFITVDQNLQYQRNILSLPLSVIILVAPDNKLGTLQPYARHVITAISDLPAKTLLRIHGDGRTEKIGTIT